MSFSNMLAILMNIGLSAMGMYFSVEENTISTSEFFIFSSIVVVPLFNIYVIAQHRRTNDRRSLGLFGMYLQRRKLEEQKRIRELEKET